MSQHDFANIFEAIPQKKLYEERTIILSESINSKSAKRVLEALLSFEAQDPDKDIWLFLNSPGGEVSSGFAIYDTMRFIRPKVKIVVTGLAASIATVILLGAAKEHRYSLPNARLLIHQPLIAGSIQGQASDIEIHAKEIIKTREKIGLLYQAETNQPLDRIKKDIERDHWMSASEALEYGLITRIVATRSEIK